jgi:hemolysin activation/secretion protein
VQRTSIGFSLLDDAYALEPGRVAPPELPSDEKLVGPFVRFEWIDDRYARVLNRNLIGRPEFYALGPASKVQLGWASTGLGSSHDALLYSASISRGFEPREDQTLMTSASVSGQYADGGFRRQLVSVQAQYYLHQSKRRLLYAGAFLDAYHRPGVADMLLLGGDNGLRGYPQRYQSGTRRALFTLEQRFYTDIYLWRLLRIGGAAFVDVGRAWGGKNVNREDPGWLADAGAGLRIVSTRAAFGNVIHLDIAMPLQPTAGVSKVQFIVKTKSTF